MPINSDCLSLCPIRGLNFEAQNYTTQFNTYDKKYKCIKTTLHYKIAKIIIKLPNYLNIKLSNQT